MMCRILHSQSSKCWPLDLLLGLKTLSKQNNCEERNGKWGGDPTFFTKTTRSKANSKRKQFRREKIRHGKNYLPTPHLEPRLPANEKSLLIGVSQFHF